MAAMHLPPRFRVADPALAATLIRQQPLASLVTLDESGLPFITHLPLHLPPAYMSPSVYADLERVPTWNYIALHATVQVTLVHAEDDKDRLLKCLIGDHEPAYAAQWRALAESYTTRMLHGIVGLEMDVIEWQCAAKVNQHRPEAREAMLTAYRAGNDQERALAQWIERLPPAAA
jgi:transcriptional regulator